MEPSAALGARTEQQQEAEMPVSLPSLYSEYIHATRYARWSDELGRREMWHETIDRFISFVTHRTSLRGYEMSDEDVEFIRSSVLRTEAMPSMRALMTAGPAAERDNIALFNCCGIVVDDPRAFDEALYMLMCGCGVGFSVERQFIADLPEVPDVIFDSEDLIVVSDSRKSWAASYRKLLAMLWAGHAPRWDLSQLRPAGARLKTFGGRSAGPAPLNDLFRYTIVIFKKAVGRRLTSIECHGLMCKIGDIVVSGGVRRSALISLSNPSDERMRDAKSGNWMKTDPHFALANNSAVWTDKPDAGRFMREWIALYESKSGERGIVNRQALIKQVESTGRRKSHYDDGSPIPFVVNPCFVGETLVDTAEGRIRIDELATRYASGEALPMTFAFDTEQTLPVLRRIRRAWVTKMSTEIVEVRTSKGVVVRCTPEHQFLVRNGLRLPGGRYVEAKDLKSGDRLRKIARFVNEQRSDRRYINHRVTDDVANGTVNQARFMWEQAYGPIPDGMDVHHVNEDPTDDRLSNFDLIDKGTHLSHHSSGSSNPRYIETERETLVEVYERAMAYSRCRRLTWHCWDRAVRELGYVGIVSRGNATKGIRGLTWAEFESDLKVDQPLVNDSVESVTWIDLDEAVPVYDVEVDGTHNFAIASEGVEHTIIVHNCSEAVLRPAGLCNLTEIVARADDTIDDLRRKATAATIMGTIQSSCTDFSYLRPIWKQNADEECLLGVSITGEMDHPVLSLQNEESERWKNELRALCVSVNEDWAERLDINQSAAATLQKPSGTVSQLVDSSSGGHARYARYYVRRTRDSKLDPVAEVVKLAGVPCEQDSYKAENWVFEWPIKAPEGSLVTSDLDAVAQLERWLHTKTHWCEHTASATIVVAEHEWMTVGAWVYEHFDDVSGLSFLPENDHVYTQAPFEEIDEEEYERRVLAMPEFIDWSMLSMIEHEDSTTSSRELACAGGSCEVDLPLQG